MEICGDKWRCDIKPVIERTRYRDLLPTKGKGSKGGIPQSIQFHNGTELRFMPGGGSDKTRASYTARVLVITEVDGMDEAGAKSREADKITQLEARTLAYGKRARIYGECTFSIEKGRTWQEVKKGTDTRIYVQCPHCRVPVHPTRESLSGWQGAENEIQAEQESAIYCPNCGEAWSEADRRAANENACLVHRGQDIAPDGTITGDLPQTRTLGFRWDAINNMLVTAGEVGAKEWRAARSVNEENAEKEMRQFVWALPHEPTALDSTPLEVEAIIGRVFHADRGFVPRPAEFITVGVDIGKWLFHWVACAWTKDGALSHVLDYGRHDVASKELGEERAVMQALRELRDTFNDGWPIVGETTHKSPSAVWIDSGYLTDVVYSFIKETANRIYMPCDGLGSAQEHRMHYTRPKTTGAVVSMIGEGWHFANLPAKRITLAEINADQWKSWAHQRLTTPHGEPGAMTLYKANFVDHLAFAKHLTAERQVEEFIAGKGVVAKWVRDRRSNHWFDALYYACAAANFCGVKIVKAQPPAAVVTRPVVDESRFRKIQFRGRS